MINPTRNVLATELTASREAPLIVVKESTAQTEEGLFLGKVVEAERRGPAQERSRAI